MRASRAIEARPTAKDSGFFYWKADLDVLLEQEYSVNTARLGIPDEKLQRITAMSLQEATQAIANHFNLSPEMGRLRMRGG